jgi:hypothetical protein
LLAAELPVEVPVERHAPAADSSSALARAIDLVSGIAGRGIRALWHESHHGCEDAAEKARATLRWAGSSS